MRAVSAQGAARRLVVFVLDGRAEAARALGMSSRTSYRRLKEHRIR